MPLIWVVPYLEFQKTRLEHTSTLSRHLCAQLLKAQADVQHLWYARRAPRGLDLSLAATYDSAEEEGFFGRCQQGEG